jgi:hypothetical protein
MMIPTACFQVIKKAVSCTLCTITGRHGRVDITSAFYSEDSGFKYRLVTGHPV